MDKYSDHWRAQLLRKKSGGILCIVIVYVKDLCVDDNVQVTKRAQRFLQGRHLSKPQPNLLSGKGVQGQYIRPLSRTHVGQKLSEVVRCCDRLR